MPVAESSNTSRPLGLPVALAQYVRPFQTSGRFPGAIEIVYDTLIGLEQRPSCVVKGVSHC
jgi:hypothetical protein